MHKKHKFLCAGGSISSHINVNKKLHLAALMSVVFLCVYTFLFLNPLPAYMDNTKATPAITSSELNVTTSDISINTSVDSPSGTFRESSPANISVTTDNYSGYTLSIDSSLDNEYANKLVNSNETAVINSISSVSTESDFTSNTWGIKPSKLEGDDNTNFIPAPSYDNTVTIDTTSGSSIEPTVYTMSIAAKVDYSLPADTYSNTYVVIAVGNPTLYTIEYDKNVDGDVSNMPATQASDTEDASITLSSTTPTSAKKYKFLSWCDGTVTDNDGIPTCDGTVYNPGDEYNLDQTTDNHVVLYGMWDRTATLLNGSDFKRKILSLANNSSNNIVAIKSADALPDNFTPATNNIISDTNSPDIYAWWDNTDNAKTIYIYSPVRIKTSTSCNDMFRSLTALTDISGLSKWDTSNTKWMSYMFSGTNSLSDISSIANWDTSNVTGMSGMFSFAKSITNIDALATGQRTGNNYVSWDTSSVTNMDNMFSGANALSDIGGAINWNTSNVKNMNSMFFSTALTNIDGAINWDTSNVTDMNSMFYKSKLLSDITGATNWDTSNVMDMHSMFEETAITNIDALATGQRTGKDYVSWNISKVTNMYRMFCNATALTNIDGAIDWDVSSVENMDTMFSLARSLADISGATNWDTSSVTNMASMFSSTAITNIDALATGQRTGKNYVSWDTSNVTTMNSMFFSVKTLTDISGATYWDTSKVTSLGSMFYETAITNIDALATGQRTGKDYVSWDTSNVTSMVSMFNKASSLTNIDGAINWNTSNVTSMYYMFNSARLLTDIDGAINWDTSNVTNMSYMFQYAYSLSDISGATNWDTSKISTTRCMFDNTAITNIDTLATGQRTGNNYISWDISNVTDMFRMFYYTRSLTDIDGAINWDTSNVTNMEEVFYYASSLSDISGATNWDTSKVTSMKSMFYYTAITNIDALATGQRTGNNYISWDTSNVTNMSSMFVGASALANINGAINWNVSSVTNMNSMFSNDSSLSDISGATYWDTSNVTNMANMFSSTAITNIDALATIQHTDKNYISWDVSNVTNMLGMFDKATSLNNVNGALNWDTSNVTSMNNGGQFGKGMFSGCTSLVNISGLTNWNTSKVTDLSYMFDRTAITNIDALATGQRTGKDYVSWDISNVTTMYQTFYGTNSLISISGAIDWDTSNVTNMHSIFTGASSLADLSGLTNWDTSSVTDMTYMFGYTAITNIDALATGQRTGKDYVSWDVSKVKSMNGMFRNTPITNVVGITNWDVATVTDMSGMFWDCTSLTDPDDLAPINSWTVNASLNKINMFRNIPTSVIRPNWF